MQTDNSLESSNNSEQQKKILRALVNAFQNVNDQPKVQVQYDSVQRLSRLFFIQKPQEGSKGNTQPISQQNQKTNKILDKVRQFFCVGEAEKKLRKFNFKTLFKALKFSQQCWFQKYYNKYSHDEVCQVRNQSIKTLQKKLQILKNQILQQNVQQCLKSQMLKQISQLRELYLRVKNTKKSIFHMFFTNNESKQKQETFMLMISLYKQFETNYTPYKRAKLKQIYKTLESSQFSNSIQVLKYLESKNTETEKLLTISQNELDKQLKLALDEQKLRYRQFEQNNKIGLVKVSQSIKRRRVVNLLISGFLSQDVDKKYQWNQLLSCMPQSEVYGLQWQSNTINHLIKYFSQSIGSLLKGIQLRQILQKDNPFIPAFEISIKTGYHLAYIVHKLFPFQFINIVGYSLGSELIRAFIQRTNQLNGATRLNKVLIMGGVTDLTMFQYTLAKSGGNIHVLNVRTKHDTVLKYMLKRAKPNIVPLGLNDISTKIGNHFITNLDVSKKINGHFSFMSNFGTIAQLLDFNQE